MDAATDLLPRIRAAVPGLRPAEARLADALLADPAAWATRPMTELAAASDTSPTTLVRFSRRLGYDSFRELRVDLATGAAEERMRAGAGADTSDIDRDDTLDEIIGKIVTNETLSISDTAAALDRAELRRAVDAVAGARRIDLFGVGASSVVRLDLEQKLSRIGLAALGWADAHAAWTAAAVLPRGSVAVGISHSGKTAETLRFLRLASERGVRTIALTNFAESPLATAADIVLLTAAREHRFRSGALGSRIAQLTVVDCLFTGVVQATYERSADAVRRTRDAVAPG